VHNLFLVYLFLVYLSISTCFGRLCAHHQEEQLCLCDTWYLLFCETYKYTKKKYTKNKLCIIWLYLQVYTGLQVNQTYNIFIVWCGYILWNILHEAVGYVLWENCHYFLSPIAKGLVPCQIMWKLLWTKWQWGGFFPQYYGFSLSVRRLQGSTIIFHLSLTLHNLSSRQRLYIKHTICL
jgi:hypothetical protein